jgi:hypothetical protein
MDLLFIKFTIPGFSIVPFVDQYGRCLIFIGRDVFPTWSLWHKKWYYGWSDIGQFYEDHRRLYYLPKEEWVKCA